jgi:peptide-methionine (S)-S-oxide reductase
MSESADLDSLFERAVTAIDAGGEAALRELLAEHPELATTRLTHPGEWLRQQVGRALDEFFREPYLIWFVAEDPTRNGTLPANITRILQIIIEEIRRVGAPTLQEQLDTTLPLVCWSGVAAESGVQLELIDILLDAGAVPAANANNALVNGHIAAAERLIERGGTLTLATALCLGRWDDVSRLNAEATEAQRQFAFVLAALNGKAEGLRRMIQSGVNVNAPSAELYAHGSPLHHAVCSGSLEAVQVLVTAGADVDQQDSAWNGTPLGWAEHYVENAPPERVAAYRAIGDYLRNQAIERSVSSP